MKKLLFIIPLVSLLLFSSCMQPTEAVVQTSVVTETQTQTVQAIPTTVINTVTVVKVVDPISGNKYVINKGEVGVANVDANVNGYFNGLNASWIGLVLNGDDTEHQFNVTVIPYSNANVVAAPDNIADWVTVTNNNLVNGVLTVAPMSAASLYTTLNVPSGINLPQNFGFIVSVSDINQGSYATANAVRWLVHMRSPS